VPKSANEIAKTLKFSSSWSSEDGKKGMKHRIYLNINIKDKSAAGDGLEETFDKVGKGLDLKWKVNTVVV
jgi:hypothetical protein